MSPFVYNYNISDRWVLTFMMPFQLSPVATRNSVRNAMPKLRKWAWSLSPSHGWASEHSAIYTLRLLHKCRPRLLVQQFHFWKGRFRAT